ncbi:MAG: 30S ribosomal protein S8 [Planctomycetes bacterium]|nr:30S ribosomal protein S8 [Planctomycetota bacterium]
MLTDPIADMLTRVRNANVIRRRTVDIPHSRLKQGIADALKREGFISDWMRIEAGARPLLRLTLKFGAEGERVIRGIDRVSSPGRRIYKGAAEVAGPVNGQGIFVLSTDRGVISDREARQKNAGGEILCRVW